MPHWRTLMDKSKYISFVDLGGKEWTLEIERVDGGELVSFGGKKAKKPLLYFKGASRPLAANVTMCKTLEGMYGGDYNGWVGKKVTLFTTTTQMQDGSTANCVRIKPGVPSSKAVTAESVGGE